MLPPQWVLSDHRAQSASKIARENTEVRQRIFCVAARGEEHGPQRFVPNGCLPNMSSLLILTTDKNTWNRGYETMGSQILEAGRLPDRKEGFYIGEAISKEHPYFVQKKLNSGPNVLPAGLKDAEEFETTSMEYYKAMHALTRDILVVLA